MKFTEYFEPLKNEDNIPLIQELIEKLFPEESHLYKYTNCGHYIIIHCRKYFYRAEIFNSGHLELYGSNAGIDFKTLYEFFKEKNIKWESEN